MGNTDYYMKNRMDYLGDIYYDYRIDSYSMPSIYNIVDSGNNIQQDYEAVLENMDIADIERFLRKKKLEAINNNRNI